MYAPKRSAEVEGSTEPAAERRWSGLERLKVSRQTGKVSEVVQMHSMLSFRRRERAESRPHEGERDGTSSPSIEIDDGCFTSLQAWLVVAPEPFRCTVSGHHQFSNCERSTREKKSDVTLARKPVAEVGPPLHCSSSAMVGRTT